MEYYLLMWNRSFDVTVTSSALSGAFVQGAIAVGSPSIVAARRLNDATQLVDQGRLAQARAQEPGSAGYLHLHRSNFTYGRSLVLVIRYDPRRKWGMGPVPHSGRLQLELRDGTRRELILLGEQDGPALLNAARELGYPIGAA